MYTNDKKEKCFTFEKTERVVKLSVENVAKLLDRYNIKIKASNGYLAIESFTNDLDDSVDYDVTLQVEDSKEYVKSYTLKTNSNFTCIQNGYEQVLSYLQ
ncbi:hypothetical protein [Aliarcobacter butzleri]|uniref:hypothetical protein n=1 Tax=Aliarcobacter butzleri TaxID=28197 RepID=UPI001269D4F9|nr:hypothetical protein [Aliarcobacter butzleri]